MSKARKTSLTLRLRGEGVSPSTVSMGELGAFLQSADELIAAIAEDLGEEGPRVPLHGVKK